MEIEKRSFKRLTIVLTLESEIAGAHEFRWWVMARKPVWEYGKG